MTLYTAIAGLGLLAVVLLVNIVRRAIGRSSPSIDLSNVTVSGQWLAQHNSHDL
jgi:hypothetical protein